MGDNGVVVAGPKFELLYQELEMARRNEREIIILNIGIGPEILDRFWLADSPAP